MTSAAQERDNIMSRLLDAVKQCQIRFGGKSELATELDSRVSCLCAAWEAALSHGLKHTNKALSTLKQMSEITGLSRISSTPGLSILGEIKNIETEPAFWHCVKEILSEHEKQRFFVLKKVNTDEGKGRAWLRSSLNEHSLERYLHMIIEDKTVLLKHFEEWSIMRDLEKVNLLPNMAAGLGSILFAISIDNEDLNCIKPATGLDSIMTSTPPVNSSYPPRVDDEPRPVIAADGSPQAERKKKKKKLKKPVKIVSFEEGDSSISASPASSVASSVVTSPRTTTSGIDFTSVASIISNAGAHKGFMSRQGSADSQASQSSFSRSKTLVLHQSSTDSVSSTTGRVIPSLGKIGKSSTTGATVHDIKHEDDKAVPGSNNDIKGSAISTDDQEVLVDADMPVTPFSNPFEGDLKPTKKERQIIPVDTGLCYASGSTGFTQSTSARLPSQSSVDSISSSNIPDVVSLSFDTPLQVEKGKMESRAEATNDKKVSSNENSREAGSQRSVTIMNNTAAYIEELLNPVKVEPATIAEEDEAPPRNSADASIATGDQAPDLLPEPKSAQPKTPSIGSTPKEILHKRTPSLGSNRSNFSNASFTSAASDSSITSANNEIPSNLTPLGPEGLIDESKRSSSFCGSEDISDVQSAGYNEMTYSAAVALAMAQEGLSHSNSYSSLRTQGDGSHAPDPAFTSTDTLSTEELKQAVIAMMMRKDEAEDQNRHIRAMFETEVEVSNALRAELGEAKKSHLAKQERDADKVRALTRENELLKHQLKKYVNAVQMLRRQGATAEDFPGIHTDDDPQPPIPPPISAIDYSSEASEYEQKLVQVAEMHGELMEFNEMLHKQLVAKDSLISRLKQELVDLRGPLPEDITVPDDDVSIVSSRSEYSLSRALIHIWIPSAFLRGNGSDGYHVYQVYIRIKDEEWNIYRRYTEFNELNNILKKKYSIISSFDFPKKKAIGNKDPKFVEDRRKKLQVYIRNIINLLTQSDPTLAANPCKRSLLEVAPFFGDISQPDKKGKGRGKSRRGAGASRSAGPTPGTSEQQYMGL